jgi:GTP-binding protein Era
MMAAVKSALEDADVGLLIIDVNDDFETNHLMFEQLKLNVPCLLILNKIDLAVNGRIAQAAAFLKPNLM